MCGWFDNCVVVLVICVLVFTVFCIVSTVFCVSYIFIYLFLFVLSVLAQELLPPSDNSIAVIIIIIIIIIINFSIQYVLGTPCHGATGLCLCPTTVQFLFTTYTADHDTVKHRKARPLKKSCHFPLERGRFCWLS